MVVLPVVLVLVKEAEREYVYKNSNPLFERAITTMATTVTLSGS